MKKAIFLFDYTGIMAKPWLDSGYECWCFDGQHSSGINRDGNHVKVGMWFDANRWIGCAQDIFEAVNTTIGEVCFVFGFPECTDMAVSGAAHFAKKKEANPNFQIEASNLAKMVGEVGELFECPWGAENPVSVLSTLWRKPDFNFHPHEYGGYLPIDDIHPEYPDYIAPRDAYPKKTCIWSGGGLNVPKVKGVGPSLHELEEGKLPADFMHLVCELFYDEEKTSPMYKEDGTPIWGYSTQHKKLGGKSLKTKNIRSATPRGFAKAVFESNSAKE